jgi:hypothetical protein
VKIFVQNIGSSPENLGGFDVHFYYNNAETTLTSFSTAPLTALGWTVNTNTPQLFVAGTHPSVTITHTGHGEISVNDNGPNGTLFPAGSAPVEVLQINFNNTVGTPTGGFGWLMSTANSGVIGYFPVDGSNLWPVVIQGAQAQSLPLELTDFSAKAAEKNIDLFWETKNENNFNGFDIERSENGGQDFQKIGFEKGKGGSTTTNYRFTDTDVKAGIDYYYRLKMLDFDGKFTFSNIQTARLLDYGQHQPSVFPNPVSDILQVDWNGFEADRISIFDIAGREIMILNGLEDVRTEISVGSLAEGWYFLRVFSVQGEAAVFRFLKKRN